MNQFKREFDKEKAFEIIRKALVGIGSPNFDDGTGLEKKSGLTNIKLENDDFVKAFKDSISPEQMKSFASLEKTILTFDLNKSSYTAELKMGEFRVRKTNKAKVADCYKTADFDLQYVLTGDEDTDKAEIEKLIKQGLEINVDELNGEEESDYGDTVMGIDYDGAYCLDSDLAHLLFNFLAKQLGFIRVSEAAYLNDLFMIDNTPIRIEKLEQVMRLEFDQTFRILKENGHDKDNEVESNDMDNYLFYVEKGDIQGCVYISQNNMFLVAKNTKTGVLKAWNTLQVSEDWFDWVSDSYTTNENDEEVFDVAVFLQGYTNAKYGNSYDYPFEFNTYGYRKSVERLMSNFEVEDSELIYDSERGFMPSKYIYFNSLVMEVNYSVDLMTDEYGIEKDLLVLTEQDINTPDYFMRSMQNFSKTFSTNRASMLYYLFLCGGNGIFWNGKTFTTGDTFNDDYPEVEEMKDYGPLGYTNPIRMMAYSAQKLFNLPEDMSNEWKQSVFELCFYMKEWIEESEKNSFDYGADTNVKETIESCYDKYYDEIVLNTIQKARAS